MDEGLIRSIRTSIQDADFVEQLTHAIATAADGIFEIEKFEGAWTDVFGRARDGTPQIAGNADGDVALISVKDLAALLKAVQMPTMGMALHDAGFRSSDRERIRVNERRAREALLRRDIRAEQDGNHALPEPGGSRMSQDEFFEFIRSREERWELIDGVPTRMPDIDQRHRNIMSNVLFAFWNQQDASECRATALDIAISTTAGTVRYPDVVVDCGERSEPTTVTVGPILVIEVLSPSTPVFDAHWKVYEYRQTPAVEYVLLIDMETTSALLHGRQGEGWDEKIFGNIDDVIEFPEIGVSLALGDIYESVEF